MLEREVDFLELREGALPELVVEELGLEQRGVGGLRDFPGEVFPFPVAYLLGFPVEECRPEHSSGRYRADSGRMILDFSSR